MIPGKLSRYLDLFVQETNEHLEAFEREIARLAKGGPEVAGLGELFRLAHSIKGSSSAMGLAPMAELAHRLEDRLERLRVTGSGPSAATIDLLVDVGDRLGAMVAAVASRSDLPSADELGARLLGWEEEPADTQPASDAIDGETGESPVVRESSDGDSSLGRSSDAAAGRHGPAAAESPAPQPVAAAKPESVKPLATTRIRTDALDDLLDEAGELVLAIAHLREEGAAGAGLDTALAALQRQAKGLHAKVLTARLVPISLLGERLQRMVRDLGRKLGKPVELELEGAEVELDRGLLESLADPLGHLLRNCVHHGIEGAWERATAGKAETGRIRLRFLGQRDRLAIEVEDDGSGMDPDEFRRRAVDLGLVPEAATRGMSDQEALRLCCLPGFSTAAAVTEVAGRGVGMDAVLREIERLGGTLGIESKAGEWTRFRLDLPLGVSVMPVLLVGVGDEIFALSLARVVVAMEGQRWDGAGVHGGSVLASHSGGASEAPASQAPVVRLSSLLDLSPTEGAGEGPLVVVEAGKGRVALQVDRLVGYEEAVLKPLAPPLDRVVGVSGAMLLGSGRPVFLLDVPRLLVPRA